MNQAFQGGMSLNDCDACSRVASRAAVTPASLYKVLL